MLSHYWMMALRSFARFRLATVLSLGCLAIGMACFIAALVTLQYLRSGDGQWAHADRTMVITQRLSNEQRGFDTGILAATSPPVPRYLREDVPGLEAVAQIEDLDDAVAIVAGERKASVRAAGANGEFLHVFDLPFAAGDPVRALEEPGSILLPEALALRLFGIVDVIGRTVRLENDVEARVTGVLRPLPQPSQFGDSALSTVRFEVLMSLDVLQALIRRSQGLSREEQPEANQWGTLPYRTYVLLPENGSITATTLNAALSGFAERHAPQERLAIVRFQFAAIPLTDTWITEFETRLMQGTGLSLSAAVMLLALLVLVTACVNSAGTTFAQALVRREEIGTRKVLGSRGVQIVAQCLVEGAALASGALGVTGLLLLASLPLAASGLGLDPSTLLARPLELGVQLLALLLFVTLCTSAGPILALARVSAASSQQRGRSRFSSGLVPKVLVGIQFGAAVILLVTVTVFHQQRARLYETAFRGYEDPVLLVGNDLRVVRIDGETLRTELLREPSIASVAMINEIPWQGGFGTLALSRTGGQGTDDVSPLIQLGAYDFLETLGVPRLAGRTFDGSRNEDISPLAFRNFDPAVTYSIVIDRTTASRLGWTNPADAVDQALYIPFSRFGAGVDQPVRVIGVVENKPLLLRAPAAGVDAAMYLMVPPGLGYPLVRIRKDQVREGVAAVNRVWDRLAPSFPLNGRFLDELFEQGYVVYEGINRSLTFLAVAASLIAMVGIFGMASFVTVRRYHEVGVRKTMGARTNQIVSLLLRDFSKPILISSLAAWPLGYLAAQAYLAGFMDRIPLTAWPFLLALGIVLLVAWLTVIGLTLRTARLNPSTVLRYG